MLTLSYYIKKAVCTGMAIGSSLYGFAQDTIMYHGGYYDGFAPSLYTGFSLQQLNQQYAYAGGSNDGYSIVNINTFSPQMPNHFAAYTADTNTRSDGYAVLEAHNYDREFLTQYTPYTSGMENDGYAGQLVLNAPLPIELISFTGEPFENTSLLKWTVADESNIARYELERSPDGKSFTLINTQEVSEPSATRAERTYTDGHPLTGKNFYRLKIYGQAGEYKYSNTILLIFNNGEMPLAVYPNPAKEQLSVRYDMPQAGMMRITDIKGAVIKTVNMPSGGHTLTIPLSGLPAGMYVLHIVNGATDKSVRFVKTE